MCLALFTTVSGGMCPGGAHARGCSLRDAWAQGKFGGGRWTFLGQMAVKGGSQEDSLQLPRQIRPERKVVKEMFSVF